LGNTIHTAEFSNKTHVELRQGVLLQHLNNHHPGLFNNCRVLIVKLTRTTKVFKHECIGIIINKCCKDENSKIKIEEKDEWVDDSDEEDNIEDFDDDMDNNILSMLRGRGNMQDDDDNDDDNEMTDINTGIITPIV